MGVAKVTLNGTTLIDVTQKTVAADKLVSSYTALDKAGENVTGNIPSLSIQDVSLIENTVQGLTYLTVSVPEGYYSQTGNKGVNPATLSGVSASINASGSAVGTINVSSAGYIGSGSYPFTVNNVVTVKSSADLTAAGSTVTVPSGYYPTQATKNIAAGTLSTPTISYNSTLQMINAYASVSTSGYLASGTSSTYAYRVSAVLPYKAAATYTPGSQAQTISANQWLAGSQTIAAIPSAYIIPSGTLSITSNSSGIDVASYASVNVSVPTGGGGGFTADEIAMRTISGSISGSATAISSYAFAFCASLTDASFSKATTIGSQAFSQCYSLKTISFPLATTVGGYAFYACNKLISAIFPSVTSIGTYAFYSCSSLTVASFPLLLSVSQNAFNYCFNLETALFESVTTISDYAFSSCYKLTNISFPLAITIGVSAFANCSSLAEASFPSATTIKSSAFMNCRNLETAIFPSVTSIAGGVFSGCYKLSTISFPLLASIGPGAFNYCSSLTTISCSLLTTIPSSAFQYCRSLTTASFGAVTYISANAFTGCYYLISLYLTSVSTVPALILTAFNSTPIGGYSNSAGRYGSVFVPSSLYASFITATNWSTISSRIVSM